MWLTVAQTAKKLGVCPETVRRYIRSGDLKHHRLGSKTIRIDENDLQTFINSSNT